MFKQNSIKTIQQFCKPAVEAGLLDQDEMREIIKTLKNSGKDEQQSQTKSDRLMKTRDVAQKLDVHPKTVLRLADRGHLKKVYVSPGNAKSLRFRLSDVEALMDGAA